MHLQEMLVQLASGLAYIHKNSIAHRDIKSSNILITAEGRLLLADFGLATILDSDVSVSKTLVSFEWLRAVEPVVQHPQPTTMLMQMSSIPCEQDI